MYTLMFLEVLTSSEYLVSLLLYFAPWWPVQDNCGSVASFLRSAASSSALHRDLDDVTIPDFSDVSYFAPAGSRNHGVSRVPACLPCFATRPSFVVHFALQRGATAHWVCVRG